MVTAPYLVSLVLQQRLQLLTQHQGAEVRHGHWFGVRPFGPHPVLTDTHTQVATNFPDVGSIHSRVLGGY